MALQISRVVTGHDQNGRATVSIDEICKNVISRRPSHSSCVVWSSGISTDNSGDADGAPGRQATAIPMAPVHWPSKVRRGAATTALSRSITRSSYQVTDMDLDGTVVHPKAGDASSAHHP
jgi:hypothetical protein